MTPFEELFDVAKKLDAAAAVGDASAVSVPLNSLGNAADGLKESFSGSWLGYHARVYYEKFAPPPAGAHFSQEWGMKNLELTSLGSRGHWREYRCDDVVSYIQKKAGNPDIEPARKAAREANAAFDVAKAEIESILSSEIADRPDSFLSKLKADLEKMDAVSKMDIVEHWRPKGAVMTRDTTAMGQGAKLPPHVDILAEIASINNAFALCKGAADVAKKAASHLERISRRNVATGRVGTNAFIGHGRSASWRELKDFVQDRLSLPWDEFNRVPVAGVTNIARLSDMLDAAAVAFLVMTAEDEMADGAVQARMNVIHEAGLFQGRLGFTRAIILLEEGCAEFSNVQGLGQIRFPKGKISACFEEVRQVLEREGLV